MLFFFVCLFAVLTKNNNKVDDDIFVTESLQEIEELQRQLEKMSNEKLELGIQLDGQKEELLLLKTEIIKLKVHDEGQTQEPKEIVTISLSNCNYSYSSSCRIAKRS